MHELTEQIQKEIRKVIIGKDDVIRKVLMAVLAQGHVSWKMCREWERRLLPWHLPGHLGWIPDEYSSPQIRCLLISSDFLYMTRKHRCFPTSRGLL